MMEKIDKNMVNPCCFMKKEDGSSLIVIVMAFALIAVMAIVIMNNSNGSMSELWQSGKSTLMGNFSDSSEIADTQMQSLHRQNQPINSSIISAEFSLSQLDEAKILTTSGANSQFSTDGGRTWQNRALVNPRSSFRMRLTTGSSPATEYTAYIQDNGKNIVRFQVTTAR